MIQQATPKIHDPPQEIDELGHVTVDGTTVTVFSLSRITMVSGGQRLTLSILYQMRRNSLFRVNTLF